MVLAPWAKPVPLTRAWCLWELYCTVDTGAVFSVCLSPAERASFELAIKDDYDAALHAFAHIQVQNAEAGSESDRHMILQAAEALPGGCDHLDAVAVGCMRTW